MSDWTDILDDVIDHVNLLRELGGRSVEIDPAVMASCVAAARPSRAAAPVPSTARSEVGRPAQPRPPDPSGGAAAAQPGPSPALTPEARRQALAEIAARIDVCDACPLRQGRTQSVPGQGNPDSPDIMFIGEAPGQDEDQQGLAFVGAAGQLLTKMIQAMGYSRDEVFIANICKCRPPNNRTPQAEEMQKCLPFLRDQVRIVRPKTIVLLGGTAIKGLLDTQVGVTRLQGQWTKYDGIPVMPTYHPAYILRFESCADASGLKAAKTQVWNALKLVLAYLGKPVPAPKKA
jgi:DNA polymerase